MWRGKLLGKFGAFAVLWAHSVVVGADTSPPTYYADVAPLLEDHCVQCHRPGNVGPMSLMTYEQVRPWAKSIGKQVVTREMPPFHAAGEIGRFKNDPRLTEEQIDTVRRWVEAGAPKGNPADFTPTRTWESSEWPAGRPDIVIKFPRFKLTPGDEDPYVYLFSDYEPPEGLWVRGFDWNFRNRDLVHHAIAYQLPTHLKPPPNRRANPRVHAVPWVPGGAASADFLPGAGPRFFPEGVAKPLPAGGAVYAVFHFSPTQEKGLWDAPELGLYLDEDGEHREFTRLDLITTDIDIAPGEKDYTQVIQRDFIVDSYVYDFHVHMHNRGESATVNFYYPDGRKETVFRLPQFRFDWQRHYTLKEPIFVPAGTTAEFVAVWDNSANNPYNPDPGKRVTYGLLTGDEMGNANISYIPKERGAIKKFWQELHELKLKVEAMPYEKMEEFAASLPEDKAKNIRKMWHDKHGPGPRRQ